MKIIGKIMVALLIAANVVLLYYTIFVANSDYALKTALKSNVFIIVPRENGRIKIGSGVILDKRHILTVAHLTRGGYFNLKVMTAGNLEIPVRIKRISPSTDLMLLEIVGSKKTDKELEDISVAIADRWSEPGEKVVSVGNPGGLAFTVSFGYVANAFFSDIRTIFDLRLMQGSSGSGIYNTDGELVAIFQGFLLDESNQSFVYGANIRTIRLFLATAK